MHFISQKNGFSTFSFAFTFKLSSPMDEVVQFCHHAKDYLEASNVQASQYVLIVLGFNCLGPNTPGMKMRNW
jgi:hypothetical protein